jgi:hypothetical protein
MTITVTIGSNDQFSFTPDFGQLDPQQYADVAARAVQALTIAGGNAMIFEDAEETEVVFLDANKNEFTDDQLDECVASGGRLTVTANGVCKLEWDTGKDDFTMWTGEFYPTHDGKKEAT